MPRNREFDFFDDETDINSKRNDGDDAGINLNFDVEAESLDPDEEAYAEREVTAENRVKVTFHIPKGMPGENGPEGPRGLPGPQGEPGVQGVKGADGKGFSIYKTYPSIADMEADFDNVPEGEYVSIATTIETEDNAKIYIRAAEEFVFILDMSGATGMKGERGEQGVQGPRGIPGTDGERGPKGDPGPQGIPGEDGEDGKPLNVKALYATYNEMVTAHPTGEVGDAYAVGTAESNVVYFWDADHMQWANAGNLKGPQGEQGPQGEDGYTPEKGVDYWTEEDKEEIVSDTEEAMQPQFDAINEKIPAQATSENKLADKNFVNSSIATETAHYIYKTNAGGEKLPFDSLAELEAYTGTVTNNDYAFVTGTDTEGNAYYDKYKAVVSGTTVSWAKEYRLNNSSFTAEQWAAISSGITSGLVALIETALQPADLEDYYTKDETDELIESVIPAYDLIGTTSDTITISPNTSVRHTGTPTAINLTLGTPETDKESEYRLTFVAGANTSLNVTAPTGYTVVYPDGQPTFTSGKIYELSFMAITSTIISCLWEEVANA